MPLTFKEIAAASVPTPAADKQTMFLDTDGIWKTKNESGTVNPLEGEDGELTFQDHGNTGATETVNATTANVHRLVLDANCTLTFAGAAASGTPSLMRLRVVQDGTGGRTITWPGSVVWVSGFAPVLQTIAGGVDIIDVETTDGGTTWYGTHRNALGPAGGAIAIEYTFSTTTTDADPGAGNLRLDNATQTSATKIRADLVDYYGTTWTAVIDSLDDSTNTVKGHIRLFKTGDPSKWLLFTVSAVDSSSGYRNITVANVAGSSASPFANGDRITLAFTRNGDVGASGTASVGTDPIFDAKGDLPVGTGADTAAKLPVGTNGSSPMADSSQITGLAYGLPGLLAYVYDTASGNVAITSTTLVDVDATNAVLTFTVPIGGKVLVRITGAATNDGDINCFVGIRESSTIIGSKVFACNPLGSGDKQWQVVIVVTGLTPGDSKTWKIAACTNSGTFTLRSATVNPLVMEVWRAP